MGRQGPALGAEGLPLTPLAVAIKQDALVIAKGSGGIHYAGTNGSQPPALLPGAGGAWEGAAAPPQPGQILSSLPGDAVHLGGGK